ncbi:MAG: ABC transporter permease [Chloroflexi bacterium]|nr:ABC transporter permease [Chloroflexota bacterium]
MLKIIFRRSLQAVLVVLGVITIIFFFLRLAPGDPVMSLAPVGTEEMHAELREELGLDKPILVQYFNFMKNIITNADFGESYFFPGRSVVSIIIERIGRTLLLAGIAIGVAILISFPLSVLAATNKGSIWDRLSLILVMLFQSAPNFWVGMIFILIISIRLRLLPSIGYQDIRYAILPGLAMSLSLTAVLTRVTRINLLDVLENEYIKAAIARGVPHRIVIWKHGIKSVAVPVMTVIAAQIGYLLSGAVVVEFVFNYPGLGLLTLYAASRRDYPLIQALAAVMALIFVFMNVLVDIIYGLIDPRVRESV